MSCFSSKENSKDSYSLTGSQERNIKKIPRIIKSVQRELTLTTNKDIKQQTKYQLKRISHLQLAWQDETKAAGTRSLCQTLRSLISLDKFSFVNFRTQAVFSDQLLILETLSSKLTRMRPLNKLGLNLFSYVLRVSGQQRERFWLALRFFHRVSELNLLWWDNTKLDSLASGLRHLRSVVIFRLTIHSHAPLNTQAIASVFSGFKHLHLLSVFCLGLAIHDDETLQTLFSGLKSLKSLSALNLKICWKTTVSSQEIESFLEGLVSVTCIAGLNFNFSDYSTFWLDNKVPEKFGWMLMQLTSLSSLTLNLPFSSKDMDNQTMMSLFRTLAKLQALSSFTLGLRTPTIVDNETCIKFLDNLMLSLPQQLKFLSLDFRSNLYIDDKGMEIFSSHLQKLSGLSQLTLNFDLSSTSSEKGVNYLCLALRHLTCLRSLAFILWSCNDIGFDMTGSLFEILTGLEFYRLVWNGVTINEKCWYSSNKA